MNGATKEKTGWKKKVAHELLEYWVNFFYLVFFFGAFAWYRRLILAEHQITYLHYGTAIVEALILAKVILIGDALRLGRKFEDRPLIIPTLYKAVVFSFFVGVFAILEHSIGALLHGKGLMGGIREILTEGKDELFARCLLTFFCFYTILRFQGIRAGAGGWEIAGALFSPP